MKKIADILTFELEAAFEKAGYDKQYAKVTLSNRPDLCEYQCNGAMAAAKAYKKAPIMIANDVVEVLKESVCIEQVEAVNPGFINIILDGEFVASYLGKMSEQEKLGVEEPTKQKTIIVDYGGANVAKPLHVGHLRSAVIGETISTRICHIQPSVVDNHLFRLIANHYFPCNLKCFEVYFHQTPEFRRILVQHMGTLLKRQSGRTVTALIGGMAGSLVGK